MICILHIVHTPAKLGATPIIEHINISAVKCVINKCSMNRCCKWCPVSTGQFVVSSEFQISLDMLPK